MLRKIACGFLLFKTVCKVGAWTYLYTQQQMTLPFWVSLSGGLFVLLALAVGAKELWFGAKSREIALVYLADIVLVAFNLVYIAVGNPLAVSTLETVITGTVLDFIIGGVFIWQLLRNHAYVTIQHRS